MLELRSISIDAGGFSLEGIDLVVEAGAWATIMGPTGCGKTTVLEAVCGLRQVTRGSVWIGPDVVTNWLPRNRGIGIVPQDGALFDGMRVEAMLALPLRARGIRRAVRRLNVQAMAEHLGIESLLRRTSAGLSGGERQRIALGRALICKPRLLCLDEPLSAVDRDTAASLRTMLIALRDQTNVTVLHVTHDAAEAKALATAIWHMEDGVLTPVTAQKV